ncbi:MAG TPA: hypothetical protein VMZ31_04385 [Phycisphaerae bacterium]|nr:hypothetical protein [Phycisphaerae bacterium]
MYAPRRRSSERVACNSELSSCNDPDLAAVVESWSQLPDPVRAGIAAMVQAVLGAIGSSAELTASGTASLGPEATSPVARDIDELRALAAQADPERLRRLRADVRMIGTALRRAKVPKPEITRIVEWETARRLRRLAARPAKRQRRQERKRYRDARTDKAVRRWEQAQGRSEGASGGCGET